MLTMFDATTVKWQSCDVITVFHQKTSMHYLAFLSGHAAGLKNQERIKFKHVQQKKV